MARQEFADNSAIVKSNQASQPHAIKAPLGMPLNDIRISLGASRLGRFARKNGTLLLMTIPGLALLLIFNYLPMVGLVIAFKDYRTYEGIFGSDWVGLQNFTYLFHTTQARLATFNTLTLNTMFIVTTLIGSLFVAVLLSEIRERHRRLANFYQSVLFFPYFLSYVIIGYMVFGVLNGDNGALNHFLSIFGIAPINWYAAPQWWPLILTIVNLWKHIGFWAIVYLAGILAINPEYYEAARIDGANWWQQTRSITLPLLTPLIIINVLLSVGRIFYADFGLFFQVTRDTPLLYSTTDVIDTFVYHALINLGDIGMAAAAGFYQAIVGFILVLLANWLVRRIQAESALF